MREGRSLRAEVDARSERTGHKIREAQLMKVPYMLVVGDREEQGRHKNGRCEPGGPETPAFEAPEV